jgi:hypothetical protein
MEKFVNYRPQFPVYFHVDWRTYRFSWSKIKPPVSFETTVRWKEYNQTITVCCFDQDNTLFTPCQLPPSFTSRDQSMLKSLLQKCVRRGLVEQAVQTAWVLLNIDAGLFLRRLPIIMIEDVVLSTACAPVIWLTSAVSKGYQLRHSQVLWLLDLVRILCLEKQTEHMIHFHPEPNQPTDSMLIKRIVTQAETDLKMCLLFSVMFRLPYGGMIHDVEMMRHCVMDWLNSTEIPPDTTPSVSPSVSPFPVRPLRRQDLLLNCADFHCFPQMITELRNTFPQYHEDQIHDCLWECNSKYNYRKETPVDSVDPQILEIWEVIKDEVERLQRHFLRI